jgi:flagellar basal-body rod modification protein FlgD
MTIDRGNRGPDFMSTTAITSTGAGSAVGASALAAISPKTLNQDDFLKLLVVQMKAQDPLNPNKDTEFIAQMTQFSALEQSKSMQKDIAELRDDQEMVQANALIGRSVALDNGTDVMLTGIVTGVEVEGGTPKIVVNGGSYELSQVVLISPPK